MVNHALVLHQLEATIRQDELTHITVHLQTEFILPILMPHPISTPAIHLRSNRQHPSERGIQRFPMMAQQVQPWSLPIPEQARWSRQRKAFSGLSLATPAAVYTPTQTGGVIIPIPAKATKTT